jgi:predicted RNA-binding Zn-ribbon protein involved in translation (DUF1610 family)
MEDFLMGLRDLSTVLVRLYGLLLLFYSFANAQQAIVYRTIDAPLEATLRVGFLSSIASAILNLVVGVCLLVFAKNIAGWVVPKRPREFNVVISVADLGILSFSVAGIVFFVDGIRWLLHDGIIWCFIPKPIGSTAPLDIRMTASLAMSGFKVVIGVFLMFGSKGVLRAFRLAQGQNAFEWKTESEEARQPTTDLSKVPKCPNCGAEYNPANYRQDASEWLCSRCGAALPKE